MDKRVSEKDLEEYDKLIEQVDEVSEEAADYLRGLLDKGLTENEFSPCRFLAACIVFRNTPQGLNYWWDIQEKLNVQVP